MIGRAARVAVVLACFLVASSARAGDPQDDEIPLLPGEEATAPAPTAPPRPVTASRRPPCPPVVRLRRIPVYDDVEVPVFEQCEVPRYREVQVPVFKNRCVPVYETRRVPVFEDRCVLTFEPPCVPRLAVVRCLAGWREEQVLRGERMERVRCGVRPHRVQDGVVERDVQTGTRTERRLVGWRTEPSREGPACAPRIVEGVLTPCGR